MANKFHGEDVVEVGNVAGFRYVITAGNESVLGRKHAAWVYDMESGKPVISYCGLLTAGGNKKRVRDYVRRWCRGTRKAWQDEAARRSA